MLAGSIYANAAWGKLFKRSILMRELVSKHGYRGISKQMQARVMLMRAYPLARFVELSSIWLRGKKYSKNLHKRQSDAAKYCVRFYLILSCGSPLILYTR